MHERLIDYIEQVRACCGERLSTAARVRHIVAAAEALVATPVPIPEVCRELPETGYGRHLLFRCPEHGFVVMALVWPAGIGTPVHDHGGWGVVAVSEGKVAVKTYLREDDGSCDGYARLIPDKELVAPAGAVATTLPPHDDWHSITNAHDGVTVTIHTYYAEMKSCRIFDVEQDSSQIKQMAYTTSQYAGV